MPTNPISALSKATSLSSPLHDIKVKRGEMPMGPIKGLLGALPSVSKVMPAMKTLGEMDPYFTAVGGEAAHNIGKIGQALKSKSIVENLPEMGWDVFKRYAARMK
jgi:hypothetical protein